MFVCPACKTEDRYGLQTPVNGEKFWACNGSHRDENGRALKSCGWTCPEAQGLEFCCVTVKEVLLQVAHDGSTLSSAVGVLALNPGAEFRKGLAEAAAQHEKLAERLRIVASFDLHREQEEDRRSGVRRV